MFTKRINKTLLCTLLALVGILTAGCASQSTPAVSANSKEMEAELAEWRKLKPGVQRLVAIEGELKGLLATLETITDNEPTAQLATAENGANVETQVISPVRFEEKSIPATNHSEVILAKENDRAVVKETDINAKNLTISTPESPVLSNAKAIAEAPAEQRRSFSLQLASVTKADSVASTWHTLKQRHPEVLNSLDLHSEEVTVANRTYYRVKAGSFDSYDEAKQNCRLLQNNGASCIVNKG
jgi:hypothetical protein